MSTIRKFEDLIAWQKARELSFEVYKVTSNGSFVKDFALREQIRRACISVVSNIAEGFERNGNKEFGQFLSVAKASAGELRAQLYIAKDIGYIDEEQFKHLLELTLNVSKLIGGLINYIRNSDLKGNKFKEDEGFYSSSQNIERNNFEL